MPVTGLLQAAIVVLALVAAVVPIPSDVIERWYSLGIYPPIQHALTPVANALPFAWLDLLSLAACALVLTTLARGIAAARRTRSPIPVMRAIAAVATAAAVVYLVFLLLWGFNYRRVPMSSRLVVTPGAPSGDAVMALGLDAAMQLNSLHDPAHRAGWGVSPQDDPAMRNAFVRVQRMLSDAPEARPGRLKGTLFGTYFRWSGVDGMINPFGLEVLSNPDLLPFERPFIAAHEWAHLAGYADESEASFVGFLTCMQADVPARYSGWMFLYWQVRGDLDTAGQQRMNEAIADGPRADLNAIVERLQRGQRPWVRVAGWRVYDQYLKANRVEAGIRSYDAVVTLILQARFGSDWTPVRAAGG